MNILEKIRNWVKKREEARQAIKAKEEEERLLPKPPYCLPGDFLIGRIVTRGYESGMEGWKPTGYGEIIRGTVQDYKPGYFKVNDLWYASGTYIGDIEVCDIIRIRDESGFFPKNG